MKPHKAPSPDSYTVQYYKTFLPIIGPWMVTFFNVVGSEAIFPRDTQKAHITLIHKEGKDLSSCGNHRPISLLNIDLKLFTKILATRLAQHLQSLVHLDQVGFIPTSEARDNTIKVLNLLHVATTKGAPCVFLSTDAEKTFDRMNWNSLNSFISFKPYPYRYHPLSSGQVQALFTRFVWAQKNVGPKCCFQNKMGDWHYHLYWVQIKQSQATIPLNSVLWCYNYLPPGLKFHPLIGTIIKHSTYAAIQTSLRPENSPTYPILGHPNFTPGLQPTKYTTLRDLGYEQASKFVTAECWPSL